MPQNEPPEEQRQRLRARTPKDYAIEFGGYLATDAKRFIEAIEVLSQAQSEVDERGECTPADDLMIDQLQVTASEALSSLQSGIYEFEKRRDRAGAHVKAAPMLIVTQNESGVISSVTSSIPMHAILVDHDTQGFAVKDPQLSHVPDSYGAMHEVNLEPLTVTVNPDYAAKIAKILSEPQPEVELAPAEAPA